MKRGRGASTEGTWWGCKESEEQKVRSERGRGVRTVKRGGQIPKRRKKYRNKEMRKENFRQEEKRIVEKSSMSVRSRVKE